MGNIEKHVLDVFFSMMVVPSWFTCFIGCFGHNISAAFFERLELKDIFLGLRHSLTAIRVSSISSEKFAGSFAMDNM